MSGEEKSVEPVFLTNAKRFDASSATQDEDPPAAPPPPKEEPPPPKKVDVIVEDKPPARAPDPVVEEVSVTIAKDGKTSFGLGLDPLGTSGRVLSIEKDGLVWKLNQTAALEAQVKVGDFLVEVNGKRGEAKAMCEEILKATNVQMKVKPALSFTASIDKKTHGKLGVGLDFLQEGNSLLVTEVRPGPIQDWNTENPDRQVKANDKIVAVNGITGTSKMLMDAVKSSPNIDIVIARPA